MFPNLNMPENVLQLTLKCYFSSDRDMPQMAYLLNFGYHGNRCCQGLNIFVHSLGTQIHCFHKVLPKSVTYHIPLFYHIGWFSLKMPLLKHTLHVHHFKPPFWVLQPLYCVQFYQDRCSTKKSISQY